MKQTVYIYRMTNDTGCAPCVFEKSYKPTPLLTLACCKGGQLRRGKYINTGLRNTIGTRHFQRIKERSEKVLVIGIMKNRIIYIAEITDICEMKEYFENPEYKSRLDCIYTCSGKAKTDHGKEFYLVRNRNNPYFHSKSETGLHHRDECGRFVLFSNSFAYFGKEEKLIANDKKLLELLPKRQETKTYSEGSDAFETIMNFVNELWNNRPQTIIYSEPSERINKSCTGCKQK